MAEHCGYVALIGRPNVGKSTLLNHILQQKLCITSRKPQTTRHRILGVDTVDTHQTIYVDTPGIHSGESKVMNRMMNRTAKSTIRDVDVVVFLVDGSRWQEEDDAILNIIQSEQVPCILALNKVDKLAEKSMLLPAIDALSKKYPFKAIIPLSAKTGLNVEQLKREVKGLLPEGPHVFEDDQFTDRSTRFLCAEILREKVFRFCGQELPYATAVEIESFKEEERLIRIHALIWVEKESHKRMVIGDKGAKLKEMATQARKDMERLLDHKVFLHCYCKVKSGWSDDERILKQFGYE